MPLLRLLLAIVLSALCSHLAATPSVALFYGDRLKALDGKRVRLRGYSVRFPEVPGGLLLTREAFSDPHAVEETDVPFDAVGVLWRPGLALPPVPDRPTIQGVLRLGNREVGETIVAIAIEDAEPVVPPRATSSR